MKCTCLFCLFVCLLLLGFFFVCLFGFCFFFLFFFVFVFFVRPVIESFFFCIVLLVFLKSTSIAVPDFLSLV